MSHADAIKRFRESPEAAMRRYLDPVRMDGILRGNADIECDWIPTTLPDKPAPLPNSEEQRALNSRTWRG